MPNDIGGNATKYLNFISHFAAQHKENPYVWLDLHNEPGSYEGIEHDFARWRNEITTILNEARLIAPNMLTLVSGNAWGQDTGPVWSSENVEPEQSALLANADIFRNNSNIVATFHMYDQWVFGKERLTNFIDQILASSDAPIIVGEYGSSNNQQNTLSASEDLHWLVQQPNYHRIGRVAWTWDAYDANDLTTSESGGGNSATSCSSMPTNLSRLGELIWQDNHQ